VNSVKQWHFEYWVKDNPECQRISINARTYEQAKQILIGRYAPVWLRPIPQDKKGADK
jgi:hypothetical protein